MTDSQAVEAPGSNNAGVVRSVGDEGHTGNGNGDAQSADVPAKKLNLAMFSVEGVIIHDIPERPTKMAIRAGQADDTAPVLSDVESVLTPEFQHYIESKIKVSLATAAFPVKFRDETESIVPPLVEEILGHPPDQGTPPPSFLEASQAMAGALHASQWANSPGGLMAVVRGAWRRKPFVAALKLEREEGLRIELDETGEQRTFLVVVEHQLVMTQNTKVFKTGIFRQTDDDEPEIEGWVADDQTGYGGSGKVVADFFVDRFLGCRLVDQPEILTKNFFDASERWINRAIGDPEERTAYLRALITEMVSNKAQIVPSGFSVEHLNGEHREHFMGALAERDAPTHAFQKDTSLIGNRLRDVEMRFKSGIAVSIAQTHFDTGRATISKDPDDLRVTVLTVRDELERIFGG